MSLSPRYDYADYDALAGGRGIGIVARQIFQGVTAPNIISRLLGRFIRLTAQGASQLYGYGRDAVEAGRKFLASGPGSPLKIGDIPIIPTLSQSLYGDHRIITESNTGLILPGDPSINWRNIVVTTDNPPDITSWIDTLRETLKTIYYPDGGHNRLDDATDYQIGWIWSARRY